MRDIKFRAIILNNDESYQTHFFTLNALINPIFSIRELVIPWMKAGNKPDTYIGLKDKNDKPIFEGDIVRWWVNDTISTAPIYYDNHFACFWMGNNIGGKYSGFVGNDWGRGEYEVLGNIYENSKLLEPANVS